MPILTKEDTRAARERVKGDNRSDALKKHEAAVLERLRCNRREAEAYRCGPVGEAIRNGLRYAGHHNIDVEGVRPVGGLVQGYRLRDLASDEDLKSKIKHYTINRTQPAVLTDVSDTLSEPIHPQVESQEQGDARGWFLSVKAGKKLYDLIYGPLDAMEKAHAEQVAALPKDIYGAVDPLVVDAMAQQSEQAALAHVQMIDSLGLRGLAKHYLIGRDGPDQMIPKDDEAVIDAVRLLTQETNQLTPGVPVLDPDDIIEVGDGLAAEIAQHTLDTLYAEANHERFVTMNKFFTVGNGWQFGRFGYRLPGSQTSRPDTLQLDNPHMLNVWIDPYPPDMSIDTARYVMFDLLMSAQEAAIHPEWPSDVRRLVKDAAATMGGQQAANYYQAYRASQIAGPHSQRLRDGNYVAVTTMYERDMQVPMTVAEALASGKVTREPLLAPLTEEESLRVMAGEFVPQDQMVDDETGQLRWTYFLAGELDPKTGEPLEVEPTDLCNRPGRHSKWPQTYGIKQTVALDGLDRIVLECRCPYVDIPLCLNINRPRMDYGPLGHGTPSVIEGIQDALNAVFTAIVSQFRRNAFTTMFLPSTFKKALDLAGATYGNLPGAIIAVDDAAFWEAMKTGGWEKFERKGEPINGQVMAAMTSLIQLLDDTAGNSAVRQGRTPFSGASGELVKELGEQGRALVSLSARWSEWAVERFAKLTLGAIAHLMSEKRLKECNDKYAMPVLRAARELIDPAKLDVQAVAATGRGVAKQVREQKALALHDRKLLSGERVLERVGEENAQTLMEEVIDEDMRRAGVQPGAMGAGPQIPGQNQPQNAAVGVAGR